jgi:hypothetical protein
MRDFQQNLVTKTVYWIVFILWVALLLRVWHWLIGR